MNIPNIPSSLASAVAGSHSASSGVKSRATSEALPARRADEFVPSVVESDATDPDARQQSNQQHANPESPRKRPRKDNAPASPEEPPHVDLTG